MANNTRHIVGGGLGTLRKRDTEAFLARQAMRAAEQDAERRLANVKAMHAVASAATKH